MALLKRKTILAAKQETTQGTAVSLAAADGKFNAMDVDITLEVPPTERWGQGSLSKLPAVPGARKATIKFYVELVGSGTGGTDPDWASTFLPACGWIGTTSVYSPVSTVATCKTLTMGVYQDGLLKQIKGAMGTWNLDASPGKPAKVNFEFTGCYVAPTDVAAITPTYPVIIPPRWANSTVTIGSYAPAPCANLKIEAGNTIYLREDPREASGYIAACITDRYVKGSVDPETSLVATKDLWGELLSGTEAAFSCSFGATTGNIITIAAPKLQWVGHNAGDRDGVLTEEMAFQCNKSAAAGNDEFTITFS